MERVVAGVERKIDRPEYFGIQYTKIYTIRSGVMKMCI